MPMPGQDAFRERLQTAVDAVFNGNVSAAAEGLGVLQPTLHKILTGRTRESKPSTVGLLADRLGVMVAWLRGESDDPVDYGPGADPPRSIPLGHHLVIAYFYTQVNGYRDWIRQLGKPKTKAGRRVLDAFLTWDAKSVEEELPGTHVKGQVAVACVAASGVEAPEHLDWLRSALAENVALHRLVVRTLERLGEKPQAYRRSWHGPGEIALTHPSASAED
jgi:hypothetical protein